MLANLLCGIALATSIFVLIFTLERFNTLSDQYAIAEREARLAQYDAQLLRSKMEAHGIDTSEH